MRYNKDQDRIEISLYEFVRTARRRISTPTPIDEPEAQAFPNARRERAAGVPHYETDFEVGEYKFRLFSHADCIRGGELCFTAAVSSPKHPDKESVAEVRARGYITAYAILKTDGLSTPFTLRYIYFNPDTGEEAEASEVAPEAKLSRFFEKCRAALEIFARPEIERVTLRLPSMKSAKFPYEHRREGQSEFIHAVYRNIARGTSLYASAPTGTGKTVSALFPAIRALGDERCEKVFYFTPKTTTADAARECLELFAESGVKIKAIILTAKERICLGGGECKRGRGYCKYSQSRGIAEAAIELYQSGSAVVGRKTVETVAKQYGVCPCELSLTYAELCDVIICDFNYLFDPRVYIRRFFDEGGNYAFLVDEAHNLVERARNMYSAELSHIELLEILERPELSECSPLRAAVTECAERFVALADAQLADEVREGKDGVLRGATHTKNPPAELYGIISQLLHESEEELRSAIRAKDEEKDARVALIKEYHYKIRDFYSALSRFDESYEMFVFKDGDNLRIKLYCIDTASAVSSRVARGRCAVFFSATLEPIDYFGALLGRDHSSEILALPSPFATEQLSVSIIDNVGTRFSERNDTLSAVCRVIAATVSARRGNYMIFSPSFAYSEALASAFSRAYPKITMLSQRRDMSIKEKREFLDKFKEESKTYLIGFCVMGGIYSEGVDLAGDALIGAVVVGVGMPALSYERGAIEAYYDEKCESGKLYSYIYPGINRVLQAAGRVIRREDDRGVIVLIDDRFNDRLYRKSMPSLWSGVKYISDAKQLRERLDGFWREVDEERRRAGDQE